MRSNSILLVDDDRAWLRGLKLTLQPLLAGVTVRTCDDPRRVIALVEEAPPLSVVVDVTMPYLTGDTLLTELRQRFPDLPVIMLTGRNEIEIAVRCMRLGAFDYCIKTDEQDRLISAVQRAIQFTTLQKENQDLRQKVLDRTLNQPQAFADIITADPRMEQVFLYLEAIASNHEAVLISGESGTGKELIARALHRLYAPDKPWIAVNVAGLDDAMFSDTLFGHVRGAFTGAQGSRPGMIRQAADGILFLDEIGDLEASSQVKLLRLLQEREFLPLGSDQVERSQCRIVCATNQSLDAKIEAGDFRRDLYYRLRTHTIQIPPLRERRGDIPLLVRHYLRAENADDSLCAPLSQALHRLPLDGNVRELRALVVDTVARIKTGLSLREIWGEDRGKDEKWGEPKEGLELAFHELLRRCDPLPTLKASSTLLVEEALQRSQGNQAQAARWLGISRAALNKRLKQKEA